MEIKESLQERLKSSFLLYGEEVAINRSIPDARDGLKLGLRQGLYAQYTNKLTCNHPFKKALKSVAAAMSQSYYHGDAAMYDTFIRSAKPWVYRYPLEEAQGAYGSPCAPDDHSASRYVEMRSSKISEYFFKNLEKNTIIDWYNNYDDTEKIPGVLPSIGFWGIINGIKGIAVGFTSSISPMNLKEVNSALIKLLQNPNISDDEIYCPPDYPSGCEIINGQETKQSILAGQGPAIKMRSIINYDKNKNALIITNIPWGVFTNTIISQIKELIETEQIKGIEKVIDYTKTEAEIYVYLSKNIDYKEIIKELYSKTSVQSSCSVRTVMLDKGRFPKIFTWREALQAHIDHEKEVYRRGFEFDLAKIEHRIHIIDGLLICLAQIDEVVSVIKNSTSSSAASINLQHNFLLDEEQAKAVLAIKLASLAKLEVEKLEQEKINLTQEANRLKIILQNEKEFNQQLINGWTEVSKKFGDSRRTIVYDNYQDEQPPKIIKNLDVYITSKDKYVVKDKNKSKIKVYKKDKIKFIMSGTTEDNFYVFTNLGKCYKTAIESFMEETEGDIAKKLNYAENEHTVAIYNPFEQAKIVFFATKLGMINKMEIEEFTKIKKEKTILTFKDEEHDELVSVLFGDGTEEIMLASKKGLGVHFDTQSLRALKAGSKGVLGMKIDIDDEVVSATLITSNTTHIASTISSAYVKRTTINDFPVQGRGTKGRIVHKLNDEEQLVEIKSLTDDDKICYSENFGDIEVENIPETGRNNKGAKIF